MQQKLGLEIWRSGVVAENESEVCESRSIIRLFCNLSNHYERGVEGFPGERGW